MLVENGGFLNSNAYTQCFVKSRILPCSVPFLINMKKTKKQVVIRFWLENGRMCGEVLGFNFQP